MAPYPTFGKRGSTVDSGGDHRYGLWNRPGSAGTHFDPFFTIKHESTEHEGTDLSLTIVHQITQERCGMIEVTSPQYGGTTFTILLPSDRRADTQIIRVAARGPSRRNVCDQRRVIFASDSLAVAR
jgi:hypothetical protein